MTTEKQRKIENNTPLTEGEFWRINGIGEATEKRLHAAGIDTFDLLASLTPEEIAETLAGQVGVKERVIRHDWIGQARKYAGELAEASKPADPGDPADRQHVESFFVELLIDDESSIRRTRVTEVRSGEKAHWAGWDSDRLFNWIAVQTGIPLNNISAHKPMKVPVKEQPAPQISGTIRTIQMTLTEKESNKIRRFYVAGQPLELHMTLDLGDTNIQPGAMLEYAVVVDGCQLETGRHFRLGEIQGQQPAGEQMGFSIPIKEIKEGTYSLGMFTRLYPIESAQPERDELKAMSEGGLVHIYARSLQPA